MSLWRDSTQPEIIPDILRLSDCRSISESIEDPKDILEIPSKCFRLPISTDLARLTILCRSESQIASELARFVEDLTASRKVRSLS